MNIYPWQQSQWAFLMRAYQQRRLSHAYLFYGRAGLGKVELAQAFSTFLLCEDKNKKNSACGKCCGCHWMRAKTHPDFFPVFPHEKGNTIKIDDIRLVIQKSTRTSQRNGFRIIFIAPAEAMPIGAANALLKTLEEPTDHVMILLVSHQTYAIPATILSRCQKILLTVDDKNVALQWFKDHIKTDQNISLLLTLSGYAPLTAKTWVDHRYLELRNAMLVHYDRLIHRNIIAITPTTTWMEYDLQLLLKMTLMFFLDMICLQLKADASYLVNQDCAETLMTMSKKISTIALFQLIDFILESQTMLAQGCSLNPLLLLESIFIQLEKRAFEVC